MKNIFKQQTQKFHLDNWGTNLGKITIFGPKLKQKYSIVNQSVTEFLFFSSVPIYQSILINFYFLKVSK